MFPKTCFFFFGGENNAINHPPTHHDQIGGFLQFPNGLFATVLPRSSLVTRFFQDFTMEDKDLT